MPSWPWSRQEKTAWEDIALTAALGLPASKPETFDDHAPPLAYLMDVVSQNPIVYSCIRELATSLAEPRWRAVVPQPNGDLEDSDGPLAALLTAPNQHQTFGDFIETGVVSLLTTGNAYLFLERIGRGGANARVGSMWWLHADRMSVLAGSGPDAVAGIAGYQYQLSETEDPVLLAPQNVGHLKMSNPTSGAKVSELYGISPCEILRNDVQLDSLLSDMSLSFLKRGSIPSGLLKLRKRLSSPDDAEQVRSRWRSSFSGRDGIWNVAVLDDDAEYQPLQALPKEIAMEATRDEAVARICAVFGVPPIVVGANLGLKRSTYSNYSQAVRAYHTETVSPLADRFSEFLNRIVAVPNFSGGVRVHPDFSNAPSWQEDQTVRAERAQMLWTSGVISLNEARDILNLDSVAGGQIRITPANVLEVEVEAPTRALEAARVIQKVPLEQSPPGALIAEGDEVPIPRAAELIRATRRREQDAIDELAKRLRAKYFKPLRMRIDGVVGRYLARATESAKEYPFDLTDLVPEGLKEELTAVLQSSVRVTLVNTFDDLADSGIVPTASFSEENLLVKRGLDDVARAADEIHDYTRQGIARTLQHGLEEGKSVSQLVNGHKDFRGLRAVLGDMDRNRVATIARTEIARATNLGTLGYYAETGLDRVQAIDGDRWDDKCRDRNGRIYTVNEAADETEHPNGTLDWVPVVAPPTRERAAAWETLIHDLDARITLQAKDAR